MGKTGISSYQELKHRLEGLRFSASGVRLVRVEDFIPWVDVLVEAIVLSPDVKLKSFCSWVIWEVALELGIIPASLFDLYHHSVQKRTAGFTIPAMNLRTFTYEHAQAMFRAAKKYNAGAFVFELAPSEVYYTNQTFLEFSIIILASAIREHYSGPVFLQGDHLQFNPRVFRKNPLQEIKKVKKIIQCALNAGFYNFDIDTSTLVNFRKKDFSEQQSMSASVCAQLTQFIRNNQPSFVNVALGGEIGELSKKNSTPEELHAFMEEFKRTYHVHQPGLSKISIQTGAFPGGVVLPDGTIAQVHIDFETIQSLSRIAQEQYGLAGVVQHGASTLPSDAFHKFVDAHTREIHLATQFQNIVYNGLPISLKERMYSWIEKTFRAERGLTDTKEQFLYKVRKRALGPFKQELFQLPKDIKNKIAYDLTKEIEFLFSELKIENTFPLVSKITNLAKTKRNLDHFVSRYKNDRACIFKT